MAARLPRTKRESAGRTRGGVCTPTMVALPLRHGRADGADMTKILTATFAALLLPAPTHHAGGQGRGSPPPHARGKGGPPPPPPAPEVDPCDGYWDLAEIVNRTAGGCVGVRNPVSLTLGFVAPLPGWSYTVDSSGGTDGRVQVSFENAATGQRAMIRVEPGKTLIR